MTKVAEKIKVFTSTYFRFFDKIPEFVVNDTLIDEIESGLLEVWQLCSKTRDTYLKNISSFKVGDRCIQLLWRSWAFYHPHKCINATDQYQLRELRNISLINIVEFIKGFHMLIRMIAIATPCLEVTQPVLGPFWLFTVMIPILIPARESWNAFQFQFRFGAFGMHSNSNSIPIGMHSFSIPFQFRTFYAEKGYSRKRRFLTFQE